MGAGPFWRSPLFLVPLALVIEIVVAVLIYWDLLGFEKRAYIARNQEIHDTLPLFPDALLLETRTSTYYGDSQLSPAEGHRTSMTYRMPAGTAWGVVLSFFRNALTDAWEVHREPPGFLSLRRGSALVSFMLRTDGPAGSPPSDDFPNQYVVTVDHQHPFPRNPTAQPSER